MTTPAEAADVRPSGESPIRLGLIGCGRFARGHLAALADMSDRATVVATADPDLDHAREAAKTCGAQTVVADYHDMLDKVDAALVVVPHHLHHEIGAAVLDAGKHLFIEKPLCNTEDECLDLIARAERAQRTLMTGYVLRYHPLVERFHQLVTEETYGPAFHITLVTEQYLPVDPGHWRANEATRGGGAFFSHGCHYIDLLLWFLGRPVRGTHLGTHSGTPWSNVETTSHSVLEFDSGAIGHHFETEGSRAPKGAGRFRAHCAEGVLELSLAQGELKLWTPEGPQLLESADRGSKYVSGELTHFLDCLTTGARPLTDGPRSLQSLRVIWALQHASEDGAVADLRGFGLDDA